MLSCVIVVAIICLWIVKSTSLPKLEVKLCTLVYTLISLCFCIRRCQSICLVIVTPRCLRLLQRTSPPLAKLALPVRTFKPIWERRQEKNMMFTSYSPSCLGQRQSSDFTVFEASCHLPICLPYTRKLHLHQLMLNV